MEVVAHERVKQELWKALVIDSGRGSVAGRVCIGDEAKEMKVGHGGIGRDGRAVVGQTDEEETAGADEEGEPAGSVFWTVFGERLQHERQRQRRGGSGGCNETRPPGKELKVLWAVLLGKRVLEAKDKKTGRIDECGGVICMCICICGHGGLEFELGGELIKLGEPLVANVVGSLGAAECGLDEGGGGILSADELSLSALGTGVGGELAWALACSGLGLAAEVDLTDRPG